MAGKTLDIKDLMTEDLLAVRISDFWVEWDNFRSPVKASWNEVRRYIFATDTTTTTNSTLPWKNKTTIPKLCQIRDNLMSNYFASLFPKRKWLSWEGDGPKDETKAKRDAIENYMKVAIDQPSFKLEVQKLLQDYVDFGNAFATPEWVDNRNEVPGQAKTQLGYVGPTARRISPLDIVFNPIAADFTSSPKIVRSILTIGEAKKLLNALSTEHNKEEIAEVFQYMMDLRSNAATNQPGDFHEKDNYLRVDGYSNYSSYLSSGYVEFLTFYGDLFDQEKNTLYENHIILVVDRHRVIAKKPNPSFFGYPPVFHSGWRNRQDNLWAMGPLDNLVGMQYRIDHLENLKADVFDLITFPPLKIKGYVEEFTWGPMEKIYVGDDGDVEMMAPPFNVLTVDNEITFLEERMEMMAGAPREAMGFRNPGEKTMYEVQRLENAYSRIFQSKISQFEEQVLEPLLNGMLELARRNLDSTQIRVFNEEFKLVDFQTLSPADITGNGRVRPLAARHFAEKAEVLQNINTFMLSPAWQDPSIKVHWSGLQISKMLEEFFDIEDYQIVSPYVQVSEQADAQREIQSAQETVAMEAGMPAGTSEDDVG
jgi:hypothetical protein